MVLLMMIWCLINAMEYVRRIALNSQQQTDYSWHNNKWANKFYLKTIHHHGIKSHDDCRNNEDPIMHQLPRFIRAVMRGSCEKSAPAIIVEEVPNNNMRLQRQVPKDWQLLLRMIMIITPLFWELIYQILLLLVWIH